MPMPGDNAPHAAPHTGLGAAIVAAIGLGIHPDAAAAVREMTRTVETRDPDPVVSTTYDELYRRVYRRLYPALRPLYEDVRRITGYPPRP